LPSVRTLNGMSRQGNYTGMMQGCKQFMETVYLAGAITKRAVYRSGYAAKGSEQMEKKILWEVMELFLLGDCLPLQMDVHRYFVPKLEPSAIAALEKQLTANLDRTRLDKES
jgi:hypothetical protein